MKKVIVSLTSLVISLVLCGTARAQAHRNAWGGGSTYHSGNSTTRTNAYGGSQRTPLDKEPLLPTHMVALHIMRKDLERRLPATPMVAARHITREVARSLQIPLARQPMVTPTTTAVHIIRLLHIRRLPTMDTIHLLPRPTTERHATTAPLARLRVPQPRAS